jgi:hypothetical protein
MRAVHRLNVGGSIAQAVGLRYSRPAPEGEPLRGSSIAAGESSEELATILPVAKLRRASCLPVG